MRASNKEKESSSSNVTKERLAGTPFERAEDLKRAQAEILEQEWRAQERCRARRELQSREEFRDNLKPLRNGVNFGYSDNNGDLFRVFVAGKEVGDEHVRIMFDERKKSEEDSSFIGATIQSVFEPFLRAFLSASGLPSSEEREAFLAKAKAELSKAQSRK